MKKQISIHLFIVFNFIIGGAIAQLPQLIKDINTVGDSAPYNFCKSNNIVFFTHDDEVHGYELWRTDGTTVGTYLVKDINVGYAGSQISEMIDFNGVLYFSAKTEENGNELWKSDGTAVGTVMVKDIKVGVDGSNPNSFTVCGEFLLFKSVDNGIAKLWQTQGTSVSTTILFSPSNQGFSDVVSVGIFFSQQIFFIGTNASGTQTGIWQASYSLLGGGSISTPTYIPNTVGAKSLTIFIKNSTSEVSLYFRTENYDLKKYNILNNTVSTVFAFSLTTSLNQKMFVHNEILYFTGYSASTGYELWKYDGTTTVLLKNINANDSPLASSSYPSGYTICNNELFFVANNGTNGTELWKTNGTAAGTVLASDVRPGTESSDILSLKSDGTNLYFYDIKLFISSFEYDIYRYNATNSTLTLIKNYSNFMDYQNSFSDVGYGEILNSTYFFTGFDVLNGFELWKTDGSVAGTAIVKNIS